MYFTSGEPTQFDKFDGLIHLVVHETRQDGAETFQPQVGWVGGWDGMGDLERPTVSRTGEEGAQ